MTRARRRGRRGLFRRWAVPGGLSAGALVIVVAAIVMGGSDSTTPQPPPVTTPILLDLFAPRDVGRLPTRADWCTAGRTAEHCWLMQEGSGDVVDTGGATALWDLTPTGSPRQGVVGSIPVVDATGFVDTSSELGAWLDGGNGVLRTLEKAAVPNLPSATNLITVTVVYNMTKPVVNARLLFGGDTAARYEIIVLGSGSLRIQAKGPTTAKSSSTPAPLLGMRCFTAVFDGRTTDAVKIYSDGVEIVPATKDLNGTGSWQTAGGAGEDVAFGNLTAPNGASTFPGAMYRARIDFAVITLAQHQEICGSLWDFDHTATKLAAADLSWTQTGAERCFAQSATTALCVPGGLPAHVWRAGLALGWALEPDRTNRILDSEDLSTGNWAGDATTLAVVAPDGSLTAWDTFVDDASSISAVPTGYTGSADVFPRLWVRCNAGSLLMGTDGAAAGSWTIDCPTVGGVWAELYDGHAAVTEGAQFAADSSGDATVIFTADATGVSFQAWQPTLTEVRGFSVIPTGGSAAATGAIAWTVDNDPETYYKGIKGKVTIRADYVAGACVDISSGTQVGRMFGDATDWLAFDSSSATAFIANLALGGIDQSIVRWNSTTSLGGTDFAQVLLNGLEQTWDATPTTGWTAASPTQILLDGFGSTSCTAAVQSVKVENSP